MIFSIQNNKNMAPRACGTPQPLAALGCPCRCAFVPHGHTKGSQGVSNGTTRARTTCPDSEPVSPESWTLHGPCPESEPENLKTRQPDNPKTRKPENADEEYMDFDGNLTQ